MFQHAIKVVLAAIVLVMGAFGADAQVPAPANRTLTRVAFGSCANQEVEQPIWLAILGYKPELFLFGGDNVYADVQDGKVVTDPSKLPGAIAAAYDKAATIPGMKLLRESVPHLAVWDDHDYGLNDGGADFPLKAEAKRQFEQTAGLVDS